ncbi:1-aminocyclopropane-1-carboxylate oxidase1 [Abeliophyllum distichum]|uniref:1-aminocyclopropane-1-carboxylate oxidase1 n=1 Tax=Abeliophyllum distichum TaxID=126358 RepID=A0ABD1NS12_9LAMI
MEVAGYDRARELKAFDDAKTGVKGLVDARVEKIPQIFVSPSDNVEEVSDTNRADFSIPVIDLEAIENDPIGHEKIVEKIRDASETWGFFQVVNHGIPVSVLEEMLRGVRRFFEQETEVKKQFYTRDVTQKVVYNSNSDLYSSPVANWRDTFFCFMAPNPPKPEELPDACRDIQIEYSKHVLRLGFRLFGLLSEALGLERSRLTDMDCANGLTFVCHYYPACPEPELTLGASKHTDDAFLTVVLQDQIGGLQVFINDKWINIPPVPGALVLISNDKFKSVEHRVLANHKGPRASVACFFSTSLAPSSKLYGPIKDLISEDNPPKYRETTVQESTSTSPTEIASEEEQNYDKISDLKAFDETKAGVKGLVDAGITKVPWIFFSPEDEFDKVSDPGKNELYVPVVDLDGVEKDTILRKNIVDIVQDASETWGFFQVINHGIPDTVLEEMLDGVRRFYEQDTEVKKEWYTRDGSKTVVYNSNFDLYRAGSANWRDTTYCNMAPNPPSPDELPKSCRDILVEYSRKVRELGRFLFELLSEALNLNPSHLIDMDCAKGLAILYHYYPACPEPELTLGASKHADYDFLTVLLQDHIGGLQVLHQNQWVDIPPVPGDLVVNIGDLLQLISNDKFKSSQHRVLANNVGPRVSVASFFTTGLMPSSKIYGHIKELLSQDNPPKYKETTVTEYSLHYNAKGLGGTSALLDFRL